MYTVKFDCPTKIAANALAILAEEGKVAELVNARLEEIELTEDNLLDDYYAEVNYDEDCCDHEVELKLA